MSSETSALVDLLATLLGSGGPRVGGVGIISLNRAQIPIVLLGPHLKKDNVEGLKTALDGIDKNRLVNEVGSDNTLLSLAAKYGAIKCFPVLLDALKGKVDLKTEFQKKSEENPLISALHNHHFTMADALLSTYKAEIDLPNIRFDIKGIHHCLLAVAAMSQNVPMWTWLLKNNYPVDKLTNLEDREFTLLDVVLANQRESLYWASTLVGKYTGPINLPPSSKLGRSLLTIGFKPEQFVDPCTKEDLTLAEYMHPEHKQESKMPDFLAAFAEALKQACNCPECKPPAPDTATETKADAAPVVVPTTETKADAAPVLIAENVTAPSPEPPKPPVQQSANSSMVEIAAAKEELMVMPHACPVM